MRLKRMLVLLLAALLSLAFVSCSKPGDKEPDATKEPQKTTPTNTGEPEETSTEKPGDTPKPTESLPKLEEEQLGKPQNDAIIIFEDKFEGGEYAPDVIIRYQKYYGIIDDRLYLSYVGATDEWFNAAQSYSPVVYCEFDEHISQFEYHITFQTSYPDDPGFKVPWMGCMVGIRVYEPSGDDYKPYDVDGGLYLSVTESNELAFYHGVPEHWPKGAGKITIPVSFKETHTLKIVDANGLVYYYVDVDGEDVLFMHVDLTGDEMIIYDAEGKEVYKAQNNLKDQTGVLKLFNHFAKTIVDEVVIKYR